MVLLEAMSHGLPVVSFACPCGPRDVINTNFGSVIKNGDIKSFADALVKWMQNPSILREGRVNAYKEIHKYTKAPIMKKWIFLFQKILKE